MMMSSKGQSLLDDIMKKKHTLACFHVVLLNSRYPHQQAGAELTPAVVHADFLCECVKVRKAVCNHR